MKRMTRTSQQGNAYNLENNQLDEDKMEVPKSKSRG